MSIFKCGQRVLYQGAVFRFKHHLEKAGFCVIANREVPSFTHTVPTTHISSEDEDDRAASLIDMPPDGSFQQVTVLAGKQFSFGAAAARWNSSFYRKAKEKEAEEKAAENVRRILAEIRAACLQGEVRKSCIIPRDAKIHRLILDALTQLGYTIVERVTTSATRIFVYWGQESLQPSEEEESE